MDELTNSLIYGLLWWDTCNLLALLVEHSEYFVDYEVLAFENWGTHMSNAHAIRVELSSVVDDLAVQEQVAPAHRTQDEMDQIDYLETQKENLEAELRQEENLVNKEQLNKLVKRTVYPTVAVLGLKFAWDLGCWLLPKMTALVA